LGKQGREVCLKANRRDFKTFSVICQLPGKRAEKPENPRAEKPLDFIEQFRSQTDELVRQREESEKKAAEYLERLQRLQADMENLQKMTKRQIEAMTKQASEDLVLKLLPILDALQQAAKITHEGNSLPPEEISVGLKMLLKQLLEILKGEGLEEIPAVGELLNPERHEVVSSIETDDVPENTIVEEVRRGYLLNGKVIRPSLVVVSKPKPSKDQKVQKGGWPKLP
jgi:molecular chaperone GrpE